MPLIVSGHGPLYAYRMTPLLGSKSLAARLLRAALLALLCVGTTQSCKAKPSEKDCETAINNVRRINGQDSSDMGADPVAMIRSCRGSSSQASVECMMQAKTEEDLLSCEGDVGNDYFDKEVKATKDRIKKSNDGDDAPDTTADEPTPKEDAVPTEGATEVEDPTKEKAEGEKDEAEKDEGEKDEAPKEAEAPKTKAP